MIGEREPETLPISSLNALEYCPRSFYYQYVQSDMLINEFVLEGTLVHKRVHQAGKQTNAEGEIHTTRMYLCSEKLRLSGFADVVEESEGMLIPVEYKHGHQGAWLNDRMQLCAQALCLEEQIAEQHHPSPLHYMERDQLHIPYGYIYYVGSRRRVRVDFDEELRTKTRAAIARAFQVAMLEKPPLPLDGKLAARCPNCSLFPLCMPDEVKLLQSRKGEDDGDIILD
jgi:CRISPR-associated exonuclease Cas4